MLKSRTKNGRSLVSMQKDQAIVLAGLFSGDF